MQSIYPTVYLYEMFNTLMMMFKRQTKASQER